MLKLLFDCHSQNFQSGSHNGSPILQPNYLIINFYNHTVSTLLLLLMNGASKRSVIPRTKRGDRAIETGWSTV